MKNKLRRTILLLLAGIILFSASMAIPALRNSKWKDFAQGGAVGLMFAGAISIIRILAENKKQGK